MNTSYPRNPPYTLEELDKETKGKLLDIFIGNPVKQWRSHLSNETIELIKSGKRINYYTFQRDYGNSFDWKTKYPLLDNEALIKVTRGAIDNCSIKEKGRYLPNSSYEEELVSSLVPLMMDRIEELEAELFKIKEDAKEVVSKSYRVIDNIPENIENKEWPFAGFVKSARYHLVKMYYLFSEGELAYEIEASTNEGNDTDKEL